ncbi:MAG: rhomboid family intramembrane serine protease [Gemmatimonadetes bacterium]|nr:rhomboid family intramembrane serine protease [Gemmatimonadota bacterium]
MRSPISLTPWVRRLLVANAVVYLLTITVFTGPWFLQLFAFDPAMALQRPWTLGTYMFLHGGFFHLAFNMLMLFFFGPAVEDWLGGTAFARYYLFCGLGGAALSFGFLLFSPVTMVIGASAAVFGVALAFAVRWPNTPIYIFPIPIPIKAFWLVIALATIDLTFALLQVQDGVAHLAHLGGFVFGLGYLRWGIGGTQRSAPTTYQEPVRVLAHPATVHDQEAKEPHQAPQRNRPSYDDVDKVLDKISATGIESLTVDERRLLDDMSQRLRRS